MMREIYEISDTISLYFLEEKQIKFVYSFLERSFNSNGYKNVRKSLEIAISGITVDFFFFMEINETRFGEENILETS